MGRRLASVIVVLALAAGGLGFGPFAGGYTLKLDFTNIDGVVKGNNVLVNGVQAGNVDNLELKDSIGVVTVTIDPKYAPLRQGTKALIRSIGLLGNKYIEILPGPASGPELPSGSELTIDSTTSPTDLDQINAIFDAPTRDKIRTLTLQGEIALGGRARVLNTDLRQLRNLAVAAEPVTGVIDEHQVALDRATIAFDTLTQGLVREDAALRGLVEHGASIFSVLQSNDAALAGLLVHGDNTLTRLDASFSGNETNFADFLARQPQRPQQHRLHPQGRHPGGQRRPADPAAAVPAAPEHPGLQPRPRRWRQPRRPQLRHPVPAREACSPSSALW